MCRETLECCNTQPHIKNVKKKKDFKRMKKTQGSVSCQCNLCKNFANNLVFKTHPQTCS